MTLLDVSVVGDPAQPAGRGEERRRRVHHWLPVLVVALAFFLRVYLLPGVPFGWHPDEATKGLMAREVLAGKSTPVFFSAYTGREALYVYLEAAAFALFGEGIFAGRVLSAFIGVATTAVTYAVGRELFSRRVGGLAAALMAVSLWHLIASRNGYRAVIQPLVQLPALYLLFRGWRADGPAHGRWYLAGAGVFLGLSQYTYTAVRAFPILIVAVASFALLLAPSHVVRRWFSLLLMFLVAAVVVLPLAVHFYHHSIDFYGRAEQISVFAPAWSSGEPLGRLWQSIKETARMFCVWGDPNYRFNLSGRPVFGIVDGALFYGGLVLALWFAVRRRGLSRLAYVLLFLWLFVMLLPMTLSAEGLPYYQRAIGTLPAVYFFPALALDAVGGWLECCVGRAARAAGSRRVARVVCGVAMALLVAWLAGRTYREYFDAWHSAPRNDDDRRVAMVYVADYLKGATLKGELYVSTEYAEHPTLAFLAAERYDGIRWFNAEQSLPLAPAGSAATYLLLAEDPPQPALMARAPSLRQVDTGHDRFGRPVFEVYRWEGGPFPEPADRSPAVWSWEVTFEPGDPDGLRHTIDLPVNFWNALAFVGHDRCCESVAAGETLDLVLYWHLFRSPGQSYSIFAHVLDNQSQIVGEYDANAYPARFWREDGGEVLLSYFPLRIKPDTPAGTYQLEIGVYHQPTGERLPIYEDGEVVADRLLLRPVIVE